MRRIKDRAGKAMTDAYLVEKLAERHPEIRQVYEEGCSYVHLCELHIFHAVRASGELKADITISQEDEGITTEMRLNAISVMARITQLILVFVDGWVQTKANPELVRNPLKHAESLIEKGHVPAAKDWLKRVIAEHPEGAVVAAAQARLAALL